MMNPNEAMVSYQMKPASIYLGNHPLHTAPKAVQGDIITLAGEAYFKISNFDQMPPFFMNVVSNSDLWMFISSKGGLTAGRRNPDNALFPYYTDDQIHDAGEITGHKAIVFVTKDGKSFLWEPFSTRYAGVYRFERNIYKNIIGNKLIFEEINHDLNICFRYAWLNCNEFGFVIRAQIENLNSMPVNVNILNGIQNILPAQVERRLQLEYSTLVDGYKKSELREASGLGLFILSSVPTDKAEPNESLKANTVWSAGLEDATILLSARQLERFRRGLAVRQETDVRGVRGAYFLQSEIELAPGSGKTWYIVADINKDHSDVAALSDFLTSRPNFQQRIEDAILNDSERLKIKIAQADGCQLTDDAFNNFRHFSNTLYNIMRGGIFDNGYLVEKDDFLRFLQTANRDTAQKYGPVLDGLPGQLNVNDLLQHIPAPDPNLERLASQYLPLTFSRRHGDPSRPWNQFSIELKDEQGNKKLDYQGNWRDIFQNWEALALSYPEYLEHMIAKFVSASTADGYNPYRVVRDGFDWEVVDPADPWSHIGYWGDHQIIYLLKLLELSHKYHPGKLQSLLSKAIFTYANVPYRIKPYHDILQDPHNTIDFDFELDGAIHARVQARGTDGKFICLEDGGIYHVNLLEKLLVPLLVKFSNFVPGAGIWMNTQRPEWNDANNALVGYGASMVTLYYLRRYVEFGIELLEAAAAERIEISAEVVAFFVQIKAALEKYRHLLGDAISDRDRKRFLDQVGQAGSDYRVNFYQNGFSGERHSLDIREVVDLLRLGKQYIDHSIATNKRDDDLYHAYNLIDLRDPDAVSIRRLYEMLEGQVAVLSAGYLSWEASVALLDSLRKSALYREDQSSYLLYPNRDLARFADKNRIAEKLIKDAGLAEGNSVLGNRNIFVKDAAGNWHFNRNLRNARLLKEALAEIKHHTPEMSDREIERTLEIYEAVFDHQSFTGRSGTFYKYEGLGSIYWHMVSKLLLAVQDTFYRALDAQADPAMLEALKAHYYEIRAGIGIHKSPELYGAFTTDAYSHTPENSGAQQPGMTGQVKEDILSRFGEFGVVVRGSKIQFHPALLKPAEFLSKPQVFEYYDVHNAQQALALSPAMLAFTICQVPVVVQLGKENKVLVTLQAGGEIETEGLEIEAALSKSIFNRDGTVAKVEVRIASHAQ